MPEKCATLIKKNSLWWFLWWHRGHKKLNAASYCIRASEGTVQLLRGKECKFPAAANSCGTKQPILRIWNSIISIHSFLSSGVCENTPQVSVEHTHALMQGGEVRNHTVSLPSPLFWETSRSDSTRCRSVEGKWEKKLWGVRAGSAGRSDWWSPGGRGGKQDVGRSNRCHIIPRKSPKSTSPFWRT